MKKFVFAAIAVCFTIYMFGCAKKEALMEESQESMSIEQLSEKAQIQTPVSGPLPSEAQLAQTDGGSKNITLEPLPPAGPYKPTTMEIQTALKNAGFYQGVLDGKKGKMTESAIKEFQRANGLDADGKVGPKTWVVLSQHLVVEPVLKKKKAR